MNQFRLMRFAVLGHRLSGLALVVFLPLHLAVFGESLKNGVALERSLAFTALPWVKPMAWLLLALLIIHLSFGIRILLIEFLPATSPAKLRLGWIGGGIAAAMLFTMLYVWR